MSMTVYWTSFKVCHQPGLFIESIVCVLWLELCYHIVHSCLNEIKQEPVYTVKLFFFMRAFKILKVLLHPFPLRSKYRQMKFSDKGLQTIGCKILSTFIFHTNKLLSLRMDLELKPLITLQYLKVQACVISFASSILMHK